MKRKAVSLVLCVVMILSAMTFSVSADAGEAQTLLKDDFTNWYTVKDEKLFSPTIEKICGIETIAPPAALKKKLSTPIDLDSENVYYASWVQSLDDISNGNSSYLKSGFVNFTAGATGEVSDGRSELVWIGNGSDIPTTKVALQKNLSDVAYKDNMVNTGTLYNVLMKIEAHESEQDKISVKIWPADCAEPLDWSGEKTENATGKREYFGVVTYSAAHFGNLNVEVYSGDKASAADKLMADAKAYAAGTTADAPSIDENSDIIANGVVYNSAKNIISLKTNTYVREIALAKITGSGSETKYTRASKITAGSNYSVVVKIANDSGAVISGKKYFAAVASYNSAGEMQRVKLCIVNSENAKENGDLAKTTGLTFDSITADEAKGKIRVYVWDAETLEPISNGVTIDESTMKNY